MKTNRYYYLNKITVVFAIIIMTMATMATAAENLPDWRITDAVEDEIIMDMAVNVNNIDIETNNGIVTLSGRVDNILSRDRAARIAETVKGVKAVVNEIEVTPPVLRSDLEIENDIKEALLMDPATESFEVGVIVDDNDVTLTGSVDSWQERKLAEKIARGVKGVKSVSNEIIVNYNRQRSDEAIKADIQEMLQWDVKVDNALIDVRVNDGMVTLTGTVGSAAEKSEAIMDAWVTGVQSVDASGLEVERWARDTDLQKDKYTGVSDEDIKTAVENALLYDPRVFAYNVTPVVENGVVTLRGEVDNLKAKRAAANDARNTVGVVRVVNRLKVRPATNLTDSQIAGRVRQSLLRDPYVDRYDITVSVVNNTARLTGNVDTYFEKAQAEDIASKVFGVIDVNNNLRVEDVYDPYVYDPYLDENYVYDLEWYTYQPGYTHKTDQQIKDDIQDELVWSPFVDAEDVNVIVDDGVATLTGSVDSWTQFHAATENALEGGATWVENELDVTM